MSVTSQVDDRLEELERQIPELVDVAALKRQLRPRVDVSELQRRDEALVKELGQLQEIWVIANLIKEIEVNLDLYEVESVWYGLGKLATKIDGLHNVNSSSEVMMRLKDHELELQDKAVEQLHVVWNQMILVSGSGDQITFNSEIDIDGNTLTFESVLQAVDQYSLVKVLKTTSSQLIDAKLMTPLLDLQHYLILEVNTISVFQSPNITVEQHLNSIHSLIEFIHLFPNATHITTYITSRIFEWLKQVLTLNIEEIYNQKELKLKFMKLHEFLTSHGVRRNDLMNWIQYEMNDIAIDFYLENHIAQMKEIMNKPFNSQQLITREIQTSIETSTSAKNNTQKTSIDKASDDNDQWDAWDDDNFDENFDDYKEQGNKPSIAKEMKADNDDDDEDDDDDNDWDAWDEDEDEEVSQSKSKLVSKLSKNKTPTPPSVQQTPTSMSYKTSQFPDLALGVFQSYISTKAQLPNDYHSSHESKLNYLVTCYFMLSTIRIPGLLLYNDLKYLTTKFPNNRLMELQTQLLYDHIHVFETELDESFQELEDLNPQLSTTVTFNILSKIQSIFQHFSNTLEILPKDAHSSVLISSINEFWTKLINCIMSRESIGEQESEYLSTMIHKFMEIDYVLDSMSLQKFVKNYTRLIHIDFILTNHLKEIMQAFYDGDFFDLDTNEIISLIDKLFADSELKRNYIDEIREIRNVED